MTGIAVSTSDTCAEISVKLNLDTASRWNFTRLRLLGYADLPCMPVITNATANTDVLPIFDKENGSYLFQFSEPKDSFTLRIRQTDSLPRNFTVCGFIAENDEDGVVYHSIGVNGAAVSSYLACENFERDLRLIKPDMVVFAIGINDAVPLNFSEERFISMYDSLKIGRAHV